MLMKTPNALRIERHRHRRREGKMVLNIEVNMHTWPEKLIELGLLPHDKAEDRAAIAEAFNCLLFDLFEKDLEDA